MRFLQLFRRLDKVTGLATPGILCKPKTMAVRGRVPVGILNSLTKGIFTISEEPKTTFDLDKY
jgi:hypothetical protein